jgi:maltose alpha-D-glucosyltransferase/alpha-amylase
MPVEVFSRNPFPSIKKAPYIVTLAPHSHYWFVLQPQSESRRLSKERVVPIVKAPADLSALFDNGQRALFEREVIPDYLRTCRWFGAKARTIRHVRILEQPGLSSEAGAARFWFIDVSYLDGPSETYALPVKIASGDEARAIAQTAPQSIIARFAGADETVLHDAIWDASFRAQLFSAIGGEQRMKGGSGDIVGIAGKMLADSPPDASASSQVLSGQQSNSSMVFANKFFLKLYRKLEDGVNPDVEITRFLTERASFPNVPAFGGALEYRRGKSEPTVVCLLQSAIPNESDGWVLTLDSVGRYYERVLGRKADLQNQTTPPGPLLEELIGGVYPEKAKLLGLRTGELHLALASSTEEPAFAPEPFNAMAQRSTYQSMRALLRRTFAVLQKQLPNLPESFREEAQEVLGAETEILAREKRLLDRRAGAAKIRIHGDYHLGQLLYTGKDFVVLDFEGEPARPLSERKLKRSPLRDVAGMMRSFQYAAYSALWQPAMRMEDVPFLERWADLWYRQMSSVFLQSYLSTTAGAVFVPPNQDDLQVFLEAYLLDKAVYEIGYELNNRPDWVVIPIRGIKHILRSGQETSDTRTL